VPRDRPPRRLRPPSFPPLIFSLLSASQTGTTALFFAAQGGFLDIAQTLLDNGAQVDSASMVSEKAVTGISVVVCGGSRLPSF
jgi:hypothetical protein